MIIEAEVSFNKNFNMKNSPICFYKTSDGWLRNKTKNYRILKLKHQFPFFKQRKQIWREL